MVKRILLLISIATSIYGIAQDDKKFLYIVDSIPIIEEPKDGFGTLNQEEIDRVVTLTDKKLINSTEFKELDEIIYVFTKAYTLRPDSIKTIPTTNLMTKKNGTWYLKSKTSPYSGPFIDYYLNGEKQGEGILFNGRLKGKRLLYHLNGNISDEYDYDNGITNGLSKRFNEDGTLMQKGGFKNGKENGIWEMYHPNGQLKQTSTFKNGKMDGESVSYYSTGEIKGKNTYENGNYKEDKIDVKIYDLYKQGQSYFKQGSFKSAIKKYSKCLELNPNWVDGYFALGTAKMNIFEFDEAIKNFDKTLEIEPYFVNAYANRAFALIRKYEFGNSRTLSKSNDIQIIASKETEIPEPELTKICADLNKGISLGDNNWMVLQAVEKHCKN